MARPLFKIAMEIASDWRTSSPQAKAYLKGMYFLLGMDDRSADLDAMSTVRFFLLYAKDWKGPVAERIKAELQDMRSRQRPTNAELLSQETYPTSAHQIDGCDLCDAPLGSPAKFVDGHTQGKKRARMCMHCNYFLGQGIDFGDGALYAQRPDGSWIHLHGEPKLLPAKIDSDAGATGPHVYQPSIPLLMRKIMRRVAKKCVALVRRVFRRAG